MKTYAVCNRLLDAETNEHCEFDGDVEVTSTFGWRCPACGAIRRTYAPALANRETDHA